MRLSASYIYLLVLTIALSGCAQLAEPFKVIWGTSTTALERVRPDGLRKTYMCSLQECFDVILTLARDKDILDLESLEEESPKEGLSLQPQQQTSSQPGKFFDIFLKDPHQKYLVVIGIVGNVDTTEAGVFLDDMGQGTVRIEISSLSSTAKRKVADAIFAELNKRFTSPSS